MTIEEMARQVLANCLNRELNSAQIIEMNEEIFADARSRGEWVELFRMIGKVGKDLHVCAQIRKPK